MAKQKVYGLVSAEEWEQIGRDDDARRAGSVEHDTLSSLLTTLAGLVTLAMLTIGPLWTLIDLVAGSKEHGPAFESLWVVPVVLTLVAAVPLAFAIRREPSTARTALAVLLAGSLVVQLATCPYF